MFLTTFADLGFLSLALGVGWEFRLFSGYVAYDLSTCAAHSTVSRKLFMSDEKLPKAFAFFFCFCPSRLHRIFQAVVV